MQDTPFDVLCYILYRLHNRSLFRIITLYCTFYYIICQLNCSIYIHYLYVRLTNKSIITNKYEYHMDSGYRDRLILLLLLLVMLLYSCPGSTSDSGSSKSHGMLFYWGSCSVIRRFAWLGFLNRQRPAGSAELRWFRPILVLAPGPFTDQLGLFRPVVVLVPGPFTDQLGLTSTNSSTGPGPYSSWSGKAL